MTLSTTPRVSGAEENSSRSLASIAFCSAISSGVKLIYHQEIIQDVVLFTSQRAANFYNKIFSSLDFALQNHSGGLPDNPQYCLSQAQLSVRGLVFVRLFQDIQRFCLVDPLFLRYSFRVLLISNLLIYTIQSADFGHQNRQYFCFILCFI